MMIIRKRMMLHDLTTLDFEVEERSLWRREAASQLIRSYLMAASHYLTGTWVADDEGAAELLASERSVSQYIWKYLGRHKLAIWRILAIKHVNLRTVELLQLCFWWRLALGYDICMGVCLPVSNWNYSAHSTSTPQPRHLRPILPMFEDGVRQEWA